MGEYRITVEYIVTANNEEEAVAMVRTQLENDDLQNLDHELRLDYMVRRVD